MISLLATLALSLGLFLTLSYENKTFSLPLWESESLGVFALNMSILAIFSFIQVKRDKT